MESHVSLTPAMSINSGGDRFIRLSLAAPASNSLIKYTFGAKQVRGSQKNLASMTISSHRDVFNL